MSTEKVKFFVELEDIIHGLVEILIYGLIALAVYFLAPGLIPYTLLEFFTIKGSSALMLKALGVLVAWGVTLPLITSIITGRRIPFSRKTILWRGFKTSLWAGIAEEFQFRYLRFFVAFAAVAITNFLFFGFLGFGIVEWMTVYILAPIANFFTLGMLSEALTANWLVAASLLGANAKFRDGHSYQGLLGIINSWLLGMAFFWLMFNFGLPIAMLGHIIYDIAVYFSAAVTNKG